MSPIFPYFAPTHSLISRSIKFMDLENLPVGYRFCPLDWELLVCYLKKKVKNEPLPPNRMMEIKLYNFTPEQLKQELKGMIFIKDVFMI